VATDSVQQPSAQPARPTFAKLVEGELERVEEILGRVVPASTPVVGEIYQSVLRGGKRLRPTLVLLSAAVFKPPDPDDEALLQAAAAVELVHVASLLHDDLIDGAAQRHGRPAAHRQWGWKGALLAGDYLAALAYRRLARALRPQVLEVLASAVTAMCEAELLALQPREMDRRTYLASAAGKTGALMGAACQIGALQAGAPTLPARALKAYGRQLGIAFQISDDLLDLFGHPEEMGKPRGQDLLAGQPNLAVILALENDAAGRLAAALAALPTAPAEVPQGIATITALVEDLGGRAAAEEMARRYAERAKDCLLRLPANPASAALAEIADFVVSRRR
jgi:heptaprenyl diphosphate synthase